MAAPLGEHEAAIWLLRTDETTDPAVLDRCASLLSEDERERHGRFQFDRDRHLFLVAHALKRTVLSKYADRDPRSWRFVKNEYGRPEPADHSGLRFNLSHTKGLAACLVTRTADAGVDVERLRDLSDLLALAERFFSPAEAASLQPLAPEARRQRFFELWTLKESYIKARGMGLALALDRFSFDTDGRLTVDPTLHDHGDQWRCGTVSPVPGFQLGWAVRDVACEVQVAWLPVADLAH